MTWRYLVAFLLLPAATAGAQGVDLANVGIEDLLRIECSGCSARPSASSR
jgi:hypothetical protein